MATYSNTIIKLFLLFLTFSFVIVTTAIEIVNQIKEAHQTDKKFYIDNERRKLFQSILMANKAGISVSKVSGATADPKLPIRTASIVPSKLGKSKDTTSSGVMKGSINEGNNVNLSSQQLSQPIIDSSDIDAEDFLSNIIKKMPTENEEQMQQNKDNEELLDQEVLNQLLLNQFHENLIGFYHNREKNVFVDRIDITNQITFPNTVSGNHDHHNPSFFTYETICLTKNKFEIVSTNDLEENSICFYSIAEYQLLPSLKDIMVKKYHVPKSFEYYRLDQGQTFEKSVA